MSKKAFSLIELIVVIAIIGIMTAIGVVSLSPAKNSARLEAASREIAATLKLAQSYALQGKAVQNAVPCGYGIYINETDSKVQYGIFYLKDSNCTAFNVDSSSVGSASMQKLENYELKNQITFGGTGNKKIYFTIPHGTVLNENGTVFASTPITLKSPDGSSKVIVINEKGSIQEN